MNAEELAHLKFENSARALRPRDSFSHSLYRTKLVIEQAKTLARLSCTVSHPSAILRETSGGTSY